MIELTAISALGSTSTTPALNQWGGTAPIALPHGITGDFASILSSGMEEVERKIANADALARQFALDDSVPVHQVTFALEEARLSLELAMQVRQRLVEGYRELMNMQL